MGNYEEKKLLYRIIESWLNNKEILIKFPNYVRDNIFVEKLSKYYAKILNSKSRKVDYFPSGYCCKNKVFIEAIKGKFEKFFSKKAKVKYLHKTKHDQPMIRINSIRINKNIEIKEDLYKYFQYYKKLLG